MTTEIAAESKPMKLTAKVYNSCIGGNFQRFAHLILPYGEVKKYFTPRKFNIATNEGEQRSNIKANLKKIETAMKTGEYTPTEIHAAVPKEFYDDVVFLKGDSSEVEFHLQEGKPIPKRMKSTATLFRLLCVWTVTRRSIS